MGLPEGQMGNSEVGHLNLGAGAVVRQDLMRIDDAIADGALAANAVLRAAFADAERVHLLGLVSDGGVHSSLEHLRGAGRARRASWRCRTSSSTPSPTGATRCPTPGAASCASSTRCRAPASAGGGPLLGDGPRPPLGSHPARLRPARPRRGAATAPRAASEAVRDAYERGETDEFIEPTLVGGEARIRPADSVLCFNFRPDRMRELTRALAEPGFGEGGEELPGWSGTRRRCAARRATRP